MEHLSYLIPAISLLTGIVLSELFNWWRRGEEFKRIVFKYKLDFYKTLVGITARISFDVVTTVDDKACTKRLSEGAEELVSFLNESLIFSSKRVVGIVIEFYFLALEQKRGLDDRKRALGLLHQDLKAACQRELGLKEINKELEKIYRSGHWLRPFRR